MTRRIEWSMIEGEMISPEMVPRTPAGADLSPGSE
jgi:hypothetical protein